MAAPAGGIASGEGAIIGNIFGIAAYAAAVGNPLELATTGVYQLPKATAAILTVGACVALDNTAKNNNVPSTGRFLAQLSGVDGAPQAAVRACICACR